MDSKYSYGIQFESVNPQNLEKSRGGGFVRRKLSNQYESSSSSSAMASDIRRRRSVSDITISSNSVSSESTSDIFYISNSYKRNNQNSQTQPNPKSTADRAINYDNKGQKRKRHTYLDVQNLTVKEKVNLARLHYFTLANVIRTTIISICFAWFVFNAYKIIHQFIQYDTIVYMEYRNPKLSVPPAITICTHCLLCGNTSKLMFVEDLLHGYNYTSSRYDSNQIVSPTNHRVNLTNIVTRCTYVDFNIQMFNGQHVTGSNVESYTCSEAVKPLLTMQDGHKCYTYFSDLNGQMTTGKQAKTDYHFQMKYEKFPYIELQLAGEFLSFPNETPMNGDKDDQIDQNTNKGIWISLHDPKILPDMLELSYHRIPSSRVISIGFLKRTEVLMPSPYQTNCFDYQSKSGYCPKLPRSRQWGWQYLDEYRSRGECYIHCLWSRLNTGPCLNFYTVFTEDMAYEAKNNTRLRKWLEENDKAELNKTHYFDDETGGELLQICPQTDITFNDYTTYRGKCLDFCKRDCNEETFIIDNIVATGVTPNTNDSLVRVKWENGPVTYLKHQEKLPVASFMGNLGGHAHVWLGISVISLFTGIARLWKSGSNYFQTQATKYCCCYCIIFWWRSCRKQAN